MREECSVVFSFVRWVAVEQEFMKKWDLCDHLSIEAVGAKNTNFMELHYNRPLVFKGNGFLETSEAHNPDA